LDRLYLRLHPLSDRLPYDREPSPPGLPADMREPQEVKGFRFPFAPLLPVLGRKAPKFQKTRFLRVQFQVELFHPFLQFSQEPLGFRLFLESHHHVVSKPHHDHFSAGDLPPPGLAPLVKVVMKVHVRHQWRCAATLGCSLFPHLHLSPSHHPPPPPLLPPAPPT